MCEEEKQNRGKMERGMQNDAIVSKNKKATSTKSSPNRKAEYTLQYIALPVHKLTEGIWLHPKYMPNVWHDGKANVIDTGVRKFGPLNAENPLFHFTKIGVEVVLQNKLCCGIWKDLNKPKSTLQFSPHLQGIA